MVTGASTILIMAGGTGGHVFPALAVAEALRVQGHQIQWLGTRHGLEAEIVPRAGFDMNYISVKGLRGNGMLGWLLAPFRLLFALTQALRICLRLHPGVVLGMGGFVTGPGGVASWLLRRPLVVHEQNAIPGMTNRWLAKLATRVLEAFPHSFKSSVAAQHTGNPVRKLITAISAPNERYASHQGAMRLLIIGGSLGAQALNDIVPAAIATLDKALCPTIWHQAGKQKNITTARRYAECNLEARVEPFIVNMAEAYAWADLVICRAGAMTVAELSNVGLASILVPYPHAVDDHQTANARYLADANAAILIRQVDLTATHLAAVLSDLLVAGRPRLLEMATIARGLGKPDATQAVAQICLEVVRE
jgi:UDP-N-acetylglucosamine--N-acetylmuramyl-(pentapeptide) pyrophosphoryl-undecaprenol N-acetylglucosamine transferase